jgi:hypothetical protein
MGKHPGKRRSWGDHMGAEDEERVAERVRRGAVNGVEGAQTTKPSYCGGFAMG